MPTIVVLGVGIAAAPIIRQTMVNAVLKRDDYKLVVVAPNTHYHWSIAMPRFVIPGLIPEEKVQVPIEPGFSEYPPSKFEFVKGKASSLDPGSKLVTVALNNGSTQSVRYDTLIIATGSRARDNMPWKNLETTEKTQASLHALQNQIKKARTIVVAGGGLTGTETAGELGFEYSQKGKKEVIFVHENALPLYDPIMDKVRNQAKIELEKLRVKIIPNSKVVSATPSGSGDTVIQVQKSDGTSQSITAQAYLPATGLIPNTEFAPASLLDARGYIKQTKLLQAEGYSNIFVVGDAGNLEPSQAMLADAQALHLIKTLPEYFSTGKASEYTLSTTPIFGITIGRSRATGQMGSMKMFSLMIWWFKGRYMGTNNSEACGVGKRTMAQKFEK